MAKDQGRNRIHIYDSSDLEFHKRHAEIQRVVQINKSLEENRFCLYAQGILAADGLDIKHYELLLRMFDDKDKIIPPNHFLPAAERYNIITKLDHWVIKTAFNYLSCHSTLLKKVDFFSINLSGQSLNDVGFLESIISEFKKSAIPANKICFEITETAAILNIDIAIEFITNLKALGCSFALDDFGSGLCSFAYLRKLPVDFLKIDGLFVKDIVDNPINYAMVRSINEVGQLMGMKTIAEFVENDEIKHGLSTIGVDYVQGYGIHEPLPLEKLSL